MHPFVLGQGSGPCSGPRFCGAGCPVAPFFGSIHDDDTRSSESSLQDPNLFDQVCTGHLASARFDRHHHWPSCHVGSPWPHSRFCAHGCRCQCTQDYHKLERGCRALDLLLTIVSDAGSRSTDQWFQSVCVIRSSGMTGVRSQQRSSSPRTARALKLVLLMA